MFRLPCKRTSNVFKQVFGRKYSAGKKDKTQFGRLFDERKRKQYKIFNNSIDRRHQAIQAASGPGEDQEWQEEAAAPAIESLTGRALWDALVTDGIRTRQSAMFSAQQAQQRLRILMANMWADSTMQSRQRLVKRWMAWAHQNRLPLNDESATLWVLAVPNLQPQGQLQYAKELAATFKHLGWERHELQTLAAALRAQGAAIPLHQAAALPKDKLVQWLSTISDQPMLQLAAMLAWKSASRWGEVSLLTLDNFVEITPEQVIVSWDVLPKTAKRNPYTPSMYTVIRGPWTSEIARLLGQVRNPKVPFCPLTTAALDHLWRRDATMLEYSAHSFKSGALAHLTHSIVQQNLQIAPHEISVLMKHKLSYDLLGGSTLRYGRQPKEMALLLGTQRVTTLL